MLTRRKAWWIKVHGSAYQRPGVPDILACYRGHFIGLEVKRPGAVTGSRPTQIQLYEIGRIEQAQGTARVVRTVEDAEKILAEVDVQAG